MSIFLWILAGVIAYLLAGIFLLFIPMNENLEHRYAKHTLYIQEYLRIPNSIWVLVLAVWPAICVRDWIFLLEDTDNVNLQEVKYNLMAFSIVVLSLFVIFIIVDLFDKGSMEWKRTLLLTAVCSGYLAMVWSISEYYKNKYAPVGRIIVVYIGCLLIYGSFFGLLARII